MTKLLTRRASSMRRKNEAFHGELCARRFRHSSACSGTRLSRLTHWLSVSRSQPSRSCKYMWVHIAGSVSPGPAPDRSGENIRTGLCEAPGSWVSSGSRSGLPRPMHPRMLHPRMLLVCLRGRPVGTCRYVSQQHVRAVIGRRAVSPVEACRKDTRD